MVITKDMNIIGVIKMFPQTAEVLQNSGMGCIGCLSAKFETIEQGAKAHDIDIDMLMVRINEAVNGERKAL